MWRRPWKEEKSWVDGYASGIRSRVTTIFIRILSIQLGYMPHDIQIRLKDLRAQCVRIRP